MSVYVLLRCAFVSFTHDESYTFLQYVIKPIDNTFDVTYTNNHLLNSLLTRVCYQWFGSDEFVLRIPNALCGILFFIYGAKLLTRIPAGKWFAPLAFVGLTFNPFMIEFFGLSRGYGIGVGLLMVSMYYQYLSFADEKTSRYEWIATIFSALALLACYTLINFFLIQLAINVYRIVYKLIKNKSTLRQNLPILISLLAFLTGAVFFLQYFLNLLFHLNELGNFNFGGQDNMWKDCVDRIAFMCCGPLAPETDLFKYIFAVGGGVVLLVAGIVCALFAIRKEWNAVNRFTLFIFLAIMGCGVAIYLQHKLMNIPYPENRTILYFIPLFSVLAFFLVGQAGRMKLLASALAAVFLMPVVATQCISFNPERAGYWPEDTEMETTVKLLIEEANRMEDIGRPRYVMVPFDVSQSFEYYMYVNGEPNLQAVSSWQPTWPVVADLAIDLKSNPFLNSDFPFEPKHETERHNIWVRKEPLKSPARIVLGIMDFENDAVDNRATLPGYQSTYAEKVDKGQMYSRFISDSLDSTYKTGTMYLLKFQLMTTQPATGAIAVMSVTRHDTLIVFNTIELIRYMHTVGEWKEISVVLHTDFPLQAGDDVGFYVSNDREDAVALDNFSVTRIGPD